MLLKLQDINKIHLFLIIIIINLILRSFFFFNLNDDTLQFSDQTKYLAISETLLNRSTFNDPYLIQRAPLYPLIIFFIRSIFDNLYFVIAIQNLIGILSLFLIYNTCKIVDKKLAILTTFLFSINLNVILYQNLIMTEGIFVTFFILSIFFLLKFLKKQKLNLLFYLSVSLAIAALIRPQIYYFPMTMFIIIFFLLKNSFKEKIKFFLIFFIIFKSLLFIWEYRNYKIHGDKFFVIAKEVNLIGYYLPHFDQYEYKIDLQKAKKERDIKWKKYLSEIDDEKIEQNNLIFKENLAVKYSLEELRKYKLSNLIKANLAGSIKTILTPSYVDIGYFFKLKKIPFSSTEGFSFLEQSLNFIKKIYKTNLTYFVFLVLSLTLIFLVRLIQIYGLIILFQKNTKFSILSILIIFFFIFLLGPLGAPKYRVPFEIFFSIYLSYGILGLKSIIKKKIT